MMSAPNVMRSKNPIRHHHDHKYRAQGQRDRRDHDDSNSPSEAQQLTSITTPTAIANLTINSFTAELILTAGR